MNILSALTKAFGENGANLIMRGANQTIDGAKEAGRHWVNTNKQVLKNTPDELFQVSDDLVNESTSLYGQSLNKKNLLDEFIFSKNIPDDVSQAVGRAFHKTGVNERLLESMRKGGYYGEVENRINPVLDFIHASGLDDAKAGVDNMAKYMIDPELADEASTAMYRNGLSIRKNVDFNDPRMSQEVRDYMHSGDFDVDYQDLLRMKAWSKFDFKDKDLILKNLDGLHGDDIKRIFKYRDEIDDLSRQVTDPADMHNLLPNYTYKMYDETIQPMLVTQKMADEMIGLGAARKINEIDIAGTKYVRVQPFKDINPERVQGAIKVSGKHSRGSVVDMSQNKMPISETAIDDIARSGYTAKTAINIHTGKEVDIGKVLYSEDVGDYVIGKVSKKLSDFEELNKGRSDFAHDVISNTIGKLHKDKNSAIMKMRVKENTVGSASGTQLDGNNALFVSFGKRKYNPITDEYHTVATDSEVRWLQQNQKVLDKDYVNLADEGVELPIDADYVHKDYYRELLGYQQWRLSDGLGWKAQMTEALYKDFIDFVRGNISIKNPAVLLNNVTAGIMMQVTDNIPIRIATKNTYEAIGALKSLHSLKSRIFKLEQDYNYLYASKTKVAKRAKEPESYIEPTLNDLQNHIFYKDIIDNARTRSASDTRYSQRLVQKRHGNEDYNVGGIYERNYESDFMLTKSDIKKIDKGEITPEIEAKIKNDIEIMENDPTWQIPDNENPFSDHYGDIDFNKLTDNIDFIKRSAGEEMAEEINRLQIQLQDNIAYQAEQSGILKSFLDEGLWDRKIRANPDEPFDASFIKNILLTEDSKWGVNVRKWHDYSDMMNRIAVYKYLTHQASPEELIKKGIKSEADIIRRIDEMFVNYSKLLPPMVAAMRRGGSVPFAQWFYRAPSFMIKQIRQHPVRAFSVFAGYEAMQTLMDDEHDIDLMHDDFTDGYIGNVHTDSKYSQNALRPSNWLDAINPIGLEPKTWLPSYIGKADKGGLDTLGITTKPY